MLVMMRASKSKVASRHLLVDTLGLLIVVVVTAASLPEREGAKLLFTQLTQSKEGLHRLIKIWVDGGYPW
jgi:hypothetical protein